MHKLPTFCMPLRKKPAPRSSENAKNLRAYFQDCFYIEGAESWHPGINYKLQLCY